MKTGVDIMDHEPTNNDLTAIFNLKQLTFIEQYMSPSEISIAEGLPIAQSIPRIPLVNKIGFALLDCIDGEDKVTIALSESECRIIRELVPITGQIGGEPVGKEIKIIIYTLLREYDNLKNIPEIEREAKKLKKASKSIPIREPNPDITKDEVQKRIDEWRAKQVD